MASVVSNGAAVSLLTLSLLMSHTLGNQESCTLVGQAKPSCTVSRLCNMSCQGLAVFLAQMSILGQGLLPV